MSLDNLQVVGAVGVNADGTIRVPDGSTTSSRVGEGTYVCQIDVEIGINEAIPIASPWADGTPEPITLVVRMETETTVRVICYSTSTGIPTDFPFNLIVYRIPQF
jgi:hypothetical protein